MIFFSKNYNYVFEFVKFMPKVLLVPFPGHDVSGLWKLTAVLAMVVVFRASSTSTEELA